MDGGPKSLLPPPPLKGAVFKLRYIKMRKPPGRPLVCVPKWLFLEIGCPYNKRSTSTICGLRLETLIWQVCGSLFDHKSFRSPCKLGQSFQGTHVEGSPSSNPSRASNRRRRRSSSAPIKAPAGVQVFYRGLVGISFGVSGAFFWRVSWDIKSTSYKINPVISQMIKCQGTPAWR